MNRKQFFDAVRPSLFNGSMTQEQVDGIEGIFNAWDRVGDGDLENFAYVLATAYHETGARMSPVREGFAVSDAAARKIVAGRRYGQPVPPHGHVYYGRGQVQLTWADNYKASSQDAGVDLFRHPDMALDPVIGARLLIRGVLDGRWNAHGRGIDHYLKGPSGSDDDLEGARRTVNITDRWQLIGGYYRKFRAALEAAHGAAPAADPTWLVQARRLAEWRARAPAGAAEVLKWVEEMPT